MTAQEAIEEIKKEFVPIADYEEAKKKGRDFDLKDEQSLVVIKSLIDQASST